MTALPRRYPLIALVLLSLLGAALQGCGAFGLAEPYPVGPVKVESELGDAWLAHAQDRARVADVTRLAKALYDTGALDETADRYADAVISRMEGNLRESYRLLKLGDIEAAADKRSLATNAIDGLRAVLGVGEQKVAAPTPAQPTVPEPYTYPSNY